MAIDVNTRLQNISTDVSAISNLVNRLVTIYSAGGVQNPDLATLKAELQDYASNASNINSGTLAVARGGTGLSASPSMIVNLASTSAANVFAASPKPGVEGVLPIANGGTGRTDGKVEDVLVNSGTISAAENGLIFPISVNSTSIISDFDNKNFFIYRNVNSVDLPNEQYLTSNSIYAETKKLNNNTFQIFYSMSGYKPTVCVRGHNGDTMSDYHPMLIASIGRNVSDTSDIYRLVLAGNSTVGNVGGLYIFGQLNIGPITPVADDTYNIGSANFQFKNLYLGSGQVVTSDSRYKQDIDNIPDEILDAWEKVSFKKFKMKNAVSEKGSNNARNHFGVVAQEVKQIYDSDNIDVTQFGFFCHDSWEAIDNTDGEGNPVHIDAGDKYSLRYDELLCLEATCQRRRANRAEARIGVLENELAELKERFALLESKVQ